MERGDKIVIGGYFVSGIEMLDNDTCAMYFEDFTEGDVMYGMVVEYWLDEDSWHFSDSKFALNGYFIDAEETTHLTEDDKEECKKFINGWLKKLDK